MMSRDNGRRSIAILAWTAGLIWVLLIFSLSSDPADVSRQKSIQVMEIIEKVVDYIEEILHIKLVDRDSLHFYVRKNAHFLSYFVLGLILITACSASGITGAKAYITAWLLAAALAVMDEFYQTFVPGRGGQLRDVFIDNAGIAGAVLVSIGFRAIKRLVRR